MASLAWETFPRSGTIWLSLCLSEAFPEHEIIAGEHRSSNLGAFPNQVISVRDPLSSVSSWIVFTKDDRNVDGVLDWYIRFHKVLAQNLDRVYALTFERLISEPDGCMNAVARRFAIPKSVTLEPSSLRTLMRNNYADHFPANDQTHYEGIRDRVKVSPRLSEAMSEYERVVTDLN